jgi:flavin reductase (DIM6/NTAB) family NADH-FMN oxidoreductase RutF
MPIAEADDTTADTAMTDPVEFRRTMAEFASGVTVVTAGDDGEPVGFACQSFSSVSLTPPLVLFCVDRRSRTWPRIRRAGRFAVNVLAEHHGELCERFGSSLGRRFDGLEWSWSRWATPVLPGVLAVVHADIHAVHGAGDHDIVIGHVVALDRAGGDRPMIFFRGRFGVDTADSNASAAWRWLDGWVA